MFKKYLTPNNFLLLGCCFLAAGIPCDGFLRGFENVGLASLLIASLLNYRNFKKENIFTPINSLLFVLFLLCIFGYAYTSDLVELNRKTALKILLALFPLAFSFNPPITNRIKKITILVFLFTSTLIAGLTCIDYFVHFKEYNLLIAQSKPIEIIGGTMHIYFSVMLALSIFLGLHLLNKNLKIIITTPFDKVILAAVVLNFLALHILSARTGLMAFYFALLVMLLRYTLITRRYRTLIGGVFAMTLFPLIMYMAVPSVKNRVNNTYEDLHRYFSGEYMGNYSISERFDTWEGTYHIFLEHKIFGVGYGDLEHYLIVQNKIEHTLLKRGDTLPNCHNQFLETLAAQGLIGFIVFLALLFSIARLVKELPKNNYLMLAFISVFLIAFMVESMLEREAGLTLFLFFLFIIKNNAYDSLKNTSVAPNP